MIVLPVRNVVIFRGVRINFWTTAKLQPSFDGTLKLIPISPPHACYPDPLLIYTTDSV